MCEHCVEVSGPNMMTPEQKKWIDEADLDTLLREWRYAPMGDPMMAGETGEYYSKVMFSKRDKDPAAWVAASKRAGWGIIKR